MTEPTDDTLQAMMLAMLHAANNSEGYAAVQQYGIGPGGDAEMRAVFRVVQDALAAQGAEPVAWGVPNTRPTERRPFMQLLHDATGCQYPEMLVPLYAAPPAAQPTAGWIACAERMPPQGEEVLVWLSEPAFKGGSHVVFDCWDEQHEAPVSFSSATIPVGPGWDSGVGWEGITHWMPLPPPPAQDER